MRDFEVCFNTVWKSVIKKVIHEILEIIIIILNLGLQVETFMSN